MGYTIGSKKIDFLKITDFPTDNELRREAGDLLAAGWTGPYNARPGFPEGPDRSQIKTYYCKGKFNGVGWKTSLTRPGMAFVDHKKNILEKHDAFTHFVLQKHLDIALAGQTDIDELERDFDAFAEKHKDTFLRRRLTERIERETL